MTIYYLEVTLTNGTKTYLKFSTKLGALNVRARITGYDSVVKTRLLIALPDGYMYPIREDRT